MPTFSPLDFAYPNLNKFRDHFYLKLCEFKFKNLMRLPPFYLTIKIV